MNQDEERANGAATSTRSDTRDGGGSMDPEVRRSRRRPSRALSASRLKHYEIVRLLGRGGSAEVFLARDTKLGRLVALKRPLRRDASSVERLLAEARILARLRHDNAIVVYELNQSFGHPFMALEYIEGETLRDLSTRLGASVRVALDVMIPVVRALGHAHALGVVHRDLKPENIMIGERGVVKIIDFGAAVWREAPSWPSEPTRNRSKTGAPIGTLRYMAPEQLREGNVDERADLWAVGLILHELAWGEHPLAPFKPGWHRRLLDLDEPLPKQGDARDTSGLASVISRCLTKRRDERMNMAAELLAELERIAGYVRRLE